MAADAVAPLSQAEFHAVTAEAKRVRAEQRQLRAEERAKPNWNTLDRPKLARLLRMPEFAELDDYTKEPLIDQAAAWELMPFDSPSQVQAMWARWYPGRGIDKPIDLKQEDLPAFFPVGFYADATWAGEAGAMMALIQCLPLPVWFVQHDDPMLWSMEHNTSWDRGNAYDFGMCVRKQGEDGGAPFAKSPYTARGMASAAVLENKLSAHLVKYGCSGRGPDRCLPLLHALRSLSPHHERLASILKQIEAEFAPTEEIRVPESLQGRWGPDAPGGRWGNLSDVERGQVRDIARNALRKVFFLSAKIPVLLDRPAEWPAEEFDRTLSALLKLSVVLKRTEWLNEGRTNLRLGVDSSYFFADPWRWLQHPDTLSPAVRQSVKKWGREYAKAPGCGLYQLQLDGFPPQFWLAYALEKLEKEHTSCGALPGRWAEQIYGQAMAQDKPRLLEPIGDLHKFVGKAGPPAVQQEIVNALGQKNCPPEGKPARHDPWGICAALSAHRAAERQRRLAGVWQGTHGTRNIMACINADGSAAYHYLHVGLDLPLVKRGEEWRESSRRAVSGFWTLTEKEADTLQGQWSDPARKRSLPINLRRISIAGAEVPCLSETYKTSRQLAAQSTARQEARDDGVSEAEPPAFLSGEVGLFPPPHGGKPWEIEGGYFTSGKWLALVCEAGKCALRPSQLTVTAIRKIAYGTAVPAQRLSWRVATAPDSAHTVAFFAANTGIAWLKPRPIPTYYSGKGPIPRLPGPGTLEALIQPGASGPSKLMPVLMLRETGGRSASLAFSVGRQRQILNSFEADEDEIAAFKPEAYLLWAGDLDGDGKPDLLLSFNPQATQAVLYLSSYAAQGELVGMAGAFEMPLERQEAAEQ